MLFNSYGFIFLFLPVVLLLFFLIGRYNSRIAAFWLFSASLFFYGWWNAAYLSLLLLSILFNYGIGRIIVSGAQARRKTIMLFGVLANLLLLSYYKYALFLIGNLNIIFGTDLMLNEIILPLGISFFTFTQIAFLVDTYQGKAKEYSLTHYGLFVTYFPHLIAGPVLHYGQMMPQFAKKATYSVHCRNISIGLTIFSIGLFKKVVIADGFSPYVGPVFDGSSNGSLFAVWFGAIAYAFQLYFDFSGYSDMAIGISKLFGIRLPLNFNSPYRAVNIIEFWRCWHMTLSAFLRDYLYIALGGNRKGRWRRHINLWITMLLGGLWHGANWNFVLWGGLHGLYLSLNHGWHALRYQAGAPTALSQWSGRIITFIAVIFAWIPFRAENIDMTWTLWRSMVGLNGVVLPATWLEKMGGLGLWASNNGILFGDPGIITTGLVNRIIWALLIVWFLPNTQQFMRGFDFVQESTGQRVGRNPLITISWSPNVAWAIFFFAMTAVALASMKAKSEFLYFQF